MLGYNIHAHEGKPRDQNTAVKRDPIELKQGLVGKQIHTDDAYDKQRYDGRGNAPEQKRGLILLPPYTVSLTDLMMLTRFFRDSEI